VSTDSSAEQAGVIFLGRVTGALLTLLLIAFGFGFIGDDASTGPTPVASEVSTQ
jgi:hypothetical protein